MNRFITRPLRAGACLALCFVAWMSGCQGDGPHAGRPDPLPLENYPHIAVERGLHQMLVFDDPVMEGPTESSPMRVTAPVRFDRDEGGAYIQYQFTFVDAHGRTVSESGWRFERLPPQWRRELSAAALDTNAVDFRLEVIRGR